MYVCSVQVYIVIRYLKKTRNQIWHMRMAVQQPHKLVLILSSCFCFKIPTSRQNTNMYYSIPYQRDIGFFAKNLYNYLIDADVRLFPQHNSDAKSNITQNDMKLALPPKSPPVKYF